MTNMFFGTDNKTNLITALSARKIALAQAIVVQQIQEAQDLQNFETKWSRTLYRYNAIVNLKKQVANGEVHATKGDKAFLDGCYHGFRFRLMELALTESPHC